jgi:cysteine synthase
MYFGSGRCDDRFQTAVEGRVLPITAMQSLEMYAHCLRQQAARCGRSSGANAHAGAALDVRTPVTRPSRARLLTHAPEIDRMASLSKRPPGPPGGRFVLVPATKMEPWNERLS